MCERERERARARARASERASERENVREGARAREKEEEKTRGSIIPGIVLMGVSTVERRLLRKKVLIFRPDVDFVENTFHRHFHNRGISN